MLGLRLGRRLGTAFAAILNLADILPARRYMALSALAGALAELVGVPFDDTPALSPRELAEAQRSPVSATVPLLPGMEEALLYFVGDRCSQDVYDNIERRISELRSSASSADKDSGRGK